MINLTGKGSRLLCFSLVRGFTYILCTVCHCVFALPFGRLCAVIVAIHGHCHTIFLRN